MRADPEPMDAALNRQTECAVVETDSHTMEAAVAYGLEMQRRMRRIGFELGIALVGKGLSGGR